MLWIHVLAGLLAILAGFVALYTRKGGDVHRRFGRLFAGAMLAMTLSATIMAAFLRPNAGNVVAAVTTFYLVCTAWLTVRTTVAASRRRLAALAALGFGIGIYALLLGQAALQTPGRTVDGIPAVAVLVFGGIAALAAGGDVRLLARGQLEGPPRLMRHLWRMTLSMWIAVSSFFLGQADEFPQVVRASGVLALPVLAVGATLLYQVAKQALAVRRHRRRPARAAGTAAPTLDGAPEA